ncbi:MAG: hypothetical protein JXR78_00730 [Victivallales bacterium]|nr:hypothetical protein [Victivallales bacterium]
MSKVKIVMLLCVLPLVLCAGIRGEKTGNWWTLGEEVKFRLSGELPSGTELIGVVRDSSGVEVATVKTGLAGAKESGWTWQPPKPGFYTVSFSIDGKDIKEKYRTGVTSTQGGKAVEADFSRSIHNFVVTANRVTPSAHLGISLGWGLHSTSVIDEHIECAGLVGAGSLRAHPVLWDKIETAKGKFDWTLTDYLLNSAHKQGFHLIACPWGTPRWALSKPQKGRNIVMRYNAQMPDNISDWTDFLRTMVLRYPFVREWELWNEPGMPGQSCFWNGTPDEICALLRAGYETIKKIQPDSSIWLSQPYLELYDVMLKKGITTYFDKLARHGKWTDAESFNAIEHKYNVSKPWANVEWHAILVSAGDHPYPSEENLSSNMLRDMMNQMRQGSDYFAVHALFNNREMETLEFARKNGNNWTHATGLFRRQPRIEPRLPALVLHNFIARLGNNLHYENGYIFPGAQCAAIINSDAGRTMFIWQDSGDKARLDSQLLAAIGKESELTDWEDRPVSAPADFILLPDHVYFLKNPDMNVVSRWTNKFQVLRRHRQKPELDMSFNAPYTPGRLFNKQMELIAPPEWTPLKHYEEIIPGREQAGFSARFAAAYSAAGLDLAVEVKDPGHFQAFSDSRIWSGDSVQFALDTTGEGLQNNRVEFSAALLQDGSTLLWKQKSPEFDGYLLQRYTEQMNPVKYGKLEITPIPGGLLYKIHIEQDELYPLRHQPSAALRFAMLVNNHDGVQRAGYLEWASGIGKFKAPALYGNLSVAAERHDVLSMSSLVVPWGAAKFRRSPDSVRIDSEAEKNSNAAAISTRQTSVTPGAAYTVSFSARGNIGLIGMLTLCHAAGGAGRRQDFLKRSILTDSWREFSAAVVIPNDISKITLALLCWKQNGWFEIKDFTMHAAGINTEERK